MGKTERTATAFGMTATDEGMTHHFHERKSIMKRFISIDDIRVPTTFASLAEAEALVKENERAFDARLDCAAAAISDDCVTRGVRILRLSGPTCAGKTTTADKLTEALEAVGRVVYPISIDDFFYDRAVLDERAKLSPSKEIDYDSVETIDLPALAACVRELMERGSTRVPIFDFKSGDRVGYKELTVPDGEEPVFLFEGIQAVYPEVAALFAGVPSRSIFINVMKDITLVDHKGNERVFSPDRIRLLRRLVRDEAKRGACPDFTLTLWRSVRANELTSILPYADNCDYGIDSTMAFDVHMLAPHLRRILTEQPCDGDEAPIADELLRSIEGVEGIPDDYLAPNSLYHEFILK